MPPKQQKSTGGKPCDPRNEIRNPLTGNCVSATGDLGKLITAIHQPGFRLQKCKDDARQVYNPVTLKCVPRSSRAGTMITSLVEHKLEHKNKTKNNNEDSHASKALRVLAMHLRQEKGKNNKNNDDPRITNALHRLSHVNRGIRAYAGINGNVMQQAFLSRIMMHFDKQRTFEVHPDEDHIEDSIVIESVDRNNNTDVKTRSRLVLHFVLMRRTLTRKWFVHEVALKLDRGLVGERLFPMANISDKVKYDNHDQMMNHWSDISRWMMNNERDRNTSTAYSCLALFVSAIRSQIKTHKRSSRLSDFNQCLDTLKNLEIKYKTKSKEALATNVHDEEQQEENGVERGGNGTMETEPWRAVLARILRESYEITSNATGLYGHKEAVAKMKDLPALLMAKTKNV